MRLPRMLYGSRPLQASSRCMASSPVCGRAMLACSPPPAAASSRSSERRQKKRANSLSGGTQCAATWRPKRWLCPRPNDNNQQRVRGCEIIRMMNGRPSEALRHTVEFGYIIHGIYHPVAYIGHFRPEPIFTWKNLRIYQDGSNETDKFDVERKSCDPGQAQALETWRGSTQCSRATQHHRIWLFSHYSWHLEDELGPTGLIIQSLISATLVRSGSRWYNRILLYVPPKNRFDGREHVLVVLDGSSFGGCTWTRPHSKKRRTLTRSVVWQLSAPCSARSQLMRNTSAHRLYSHRHSQLHTRIACP